MADIDSSHRKTIRNTASFRIAQLAVAHRRLADSVLRGLGLHVGQEMLMNALWEEGAEISQSELAERLGVKPSTITVSLRALEKAGFVARRRDSDDQRVMLVQSTKTGNALQKQVNEAWEELEMKTIGGLTGVEVEQFNNLLTKVTNRLGP